MKVTSFRAFALCIGLSSMGMITASFHLSSERNRNRRPSMSTRYDQWSRETYQPRVHVYEVSRNHIEQNYVRKVDPTTINHLYHTVWEWCIPGMADPKERAVKLATMIANASKPEVSSRQQFDTFTKELGLRIKEGNISLALDLTVPGIMQRNYTSTIIEENGKRFVGYGEIDSGSIRDWIINSINYNDNLTATGVPEGYIHFGDKILRLKEIQKLLGCFPPTTASASSSNSMELPSVSFSGVMKAVATVAVISAAVLYLAKSGKNENKRGVTYAAPRKSTSSLTTKA